MILTDLFRAALASVGLYLLVFTALLDRPLSHGELRHRIEAKLAIAAGIETPKLMILAGSNGPYSHRCEELSAALDQPCLNGGVAVGIGLHYLFARWRPLLRPSDIVYLPLEQAQNVRSRAAALVGPGATIMARHDRRPWVGCPGTGGWARCSPSTCAPWSRACWK